MVFRDDAPVWAGDEERKPCFRGPNRELSGGFAAIACNEQHRASGGGERLHYRIEPARTDFIFFYRRDSGCAGGTSGIAAVAVQRMRGELDENRSALSSVGKLNRVSHHLADLAGLRRAQCLLDQWSRQRCLIERLKRRLARWANGRRDREMHQRDAIELCFGESGGGKRDARARDREQNADLSRRTRIAV